MEDIIPPNAGRDVEHPELLYHYEDLESGGGVIFPSIIDIHKTPCQNQYVNPRTTKCCAVFGGDHTRKNSDLEGIDESLNAEQISLQDVFPFFPYVQKGGWSMTGFLQMAKNSGLIHGYAVIPNNKASFFQALYIGRGIYCGSDKIDFGQMKAKKVRKAIIGSGPGHIWSICKIDEINDEIQVHDSEGDNGWYGTGHFLISIPDLIGSCYTKVIFLNKQESQSLQEITDERMIQKAINAGITNGSDLDTFVTREQASVMIERAIEGHDLEYTLAATKAMENNIRNGLRPLDSCSRGELMLMVASMLGVREKDDSMSIANLINKGITGGTRRDDHITRRDTVIMIMRASIALEKK